jgi:hypothetical protein
MLGAGIGAPIPLRCNGPTNDKSFARKIKFTIFGGNPVFFVGTHYRDGLQFSLS